MAAVDHSLLQKLQKLSYKVTAPVCLHVNEQLLRCDKLIRAVPGKRLVFQGTFSSNISSEKIVDEKVIIKLFLHPDRAKKHWSRERAGAQLLRERQIPTPELIADGLADEGVYFLLFRYIEGQNLAQFWAAHNQTERWQKLKQLMPVLALHHQQGLAHQDLHYANFFLADVIYTLDGEEVKSASAPLTQQTRLKNLALFLAQTFDLTPEINRELLQDYLALAALSLTEQEVVQFLQWIKHYQQMRIRQYLKKILRECTDVIYDKKSNSSVKSYTLCRRQYHSPAIQQLLDDPEAFFQQDQAVFLKQGNTCTVKSVMLDNERYVIKRYNPKGAAYELSHSGQMSRARKSWINAHLLQFMGILTPAPVALIERSPALGKRCSYFICRYQPGQDSWDFFCDADTDSAALIKAKKSAAAALVSTLKQLGEYYISHGDLKGSNFIIHENRVWLLDLDAMTQHKMAWRFKQSWQRDKQRFLKNWDKKACYKQWKAYFSHALEKL